MGFHLHGGDLQSSHHTRRLMKCLVYIRMNTMGVVRVRKITKHVMVIYAREGGSMRLEMTPGGAVSAGVRAGSDMTLLERTHDVR